MQLNLDDETKSMSRSDRPGSRPGLVSPLEKDIGSLEKLSLSRTAGGPTPSPPPNPLKRSSGMREALPAAEPKKHEGTTRSRQGKALPGGPPQNSDSDYDRRVTFTSDNHLGRAPQIGPKRRLYVPGSDSPVANKSYNSRTRTFRPKKAQHDYDEDSTATASGQQYPIYIEKAPVRSSSPNSKPMPKEIPMKLLTTPAAPDRPADPPPEMLLQPETRAISHAQLAVEVKGIYAGLVMVEAKCVDVDEKQSIAALEKDPTRQTKLSNEQWQALIALHRTLLHEHHDFFLASQHPSAGPALTRLAAQYSMPARMWRHGIHSFLEVLRHRLPESLEHMLAFIYIAYSMMALLYETVTAFEDTWIECLGDLGRYRMAIEDADRHDREVWSGVARFWYSKAADRNPHIGRLYHHLAILARPGSLEQLSFYTRSLTCIQPFTTARSSILTVFKPALQGENATLSRTSQVEILFIKAHAFLFSGSSLPEYDALVGQLFSGLLDHYIGKVTAKFKAQGVFAAVINIAALFEYGAHKSDGSSRSIFRLAFDEFEISRKSFESLSPAITHRKQVIDDGGDQSSVSDRRESPSTDLTPKELRDSEEAVARGSRIMSVTLSVALQRIGDKNVHPLVHVSLVFLYRLGIVGKPVQYVEKDVPWVEISFFLNTLAKSVDNASTFEAEEFPWPAEGAGRSLPEDFVIRGQVWSRGHFPEKWFEDAKVDDEERSMEVPSMAAPRVERILWLGVRLASLDQWISYDRESRTFSTTTYVTALCAERSSSATRVPLSQTKGEDEVISKGMDMGDPIPYPSKMSANEVDMDTDKDMIERPANKGQKLDENERDRASVDVCVVNRNTPDQYSTEPNPDTAAWLDGTCGAAKLSLQKTPTTEYPSISGDVHLPGHHQYNNNNDKI